MKLRCTQIRMIGSPSTARSCPLLGSFSYFGVTPQGSGGRSANSGINTPTTRGLDPEGACKEMSPVLRSGLLEPRGSLGSCPGWLSRFTGASARAACVEEAFGRPCDGGGRMPARLPVDLVSAGQLVVVTACDLREHRQYESARDQPRHGRP